MTGEYRLLTNKIKDNMTIIEPCCKKTQFTKLLSHLKQAQPEKFAYYGDVSFRAWLSILVLENRNSDATITLRALDFDTLTYLCKEMNDRACIVGKPEAMVLNNVHIIIDNSDPDTEALILNLPPEAKKLIDAGRLKITAPEKDIRQDKIVLQNDLWQYTMQGIFFATRNTAQRIVTITKKAAPQKPTSAPAPQPSNETEEASSQPAEA